jgi:ABC-type amino acid transport system permease subunit
VQFFRNMPLILQALFWFAVISHMPGPRQALRFAGFVVSNRGVSVPFFTPAGLSAAAAALVGAVVVVVVLMLRRFRPFQRGRTLIALATAALLAFTTWAAVFPGRAIWSVPDLTGFNFTGGVHVPTELISILTALSLFGSAYIAEIVRGGFETVPKGVIEAARALALPAWAVEAKVRVPLALRAIILPLGSQYTTLIKATSIGLAIGFTDLFAVTLMSINQSGHTISLLCVMTACYVLLNQAVVSAANALNHAFQIPGTSAA